MPRPIPGGGGGGIPIPGGGGGCAIPPTPCTGAAPNPNYKRGLRVIRI